MQKYWIVCGLAAAAALGCSKGGGGQSVAPTSIAKITEDARVVPPGSTAGAPAVRLVRDGTPVDGVTVTCTVTGGGSVASGTATSGSDGVASCGTWTVGPARGLNTLTIVAAGLPPVLFAAMAGATSPDLAVRIDLQRPQPNGFVGDVIDPLITVRSTYQIDAVQGRVGATEFALVASSGPDPTAWVTTVSVADQPSGDLAMVVTATDHYGSTTDAVRVFRLDRRPTIVVGAPSDRTLSRGTLTVQVGCEDVEGPCTQADVYVASELVARGVPPLTATLDLARWDGQAVQVALEVRDAASQSTSAARTVFVESSPRLSLRQASPGNVVAVAANRTLFIDPDSMVQVDTTVSAVLSLQDAAGVVTTAPFSVRDAFPWGQATCGADLSRAAGAITAHAILVWIPYHGPIPGEPGDPDCALAVLEWRGGRVTSLGVVPMDGLAVVGDLAALAVEAPHRRDEPFPLDLVLRDLAAGVDTSFASTDTPPTAFGGLDLAANGDVVYGDTVGVVRYRAGATARITACGSAPRTDGTGIVYTECSPDHGVVLSRGGVETVLASSVGFPPPYAIRDGWVAYGKPNAGGAFQTWRAGSLGPEQLSFFSTTSTRVEAMADGGVTVFTGGARRYLSAPGAAPVHVGGALGRPVFLDGKLLVLVGAHVLELAP